MTSHRAIWTFAAILMMALFVVPQVHAYVINFDNLADSTPVTNQYGYLGLTFTHATVLTAGVSLNEVDFPPMSGTNVVFDDGGPMVIDFSTLVTSAGGYFTYGTNLAIEAFDSLNALIGTVYSSASSNLGSNEFLQFTFAGGISQLVITGDVAGASFTLDDFTATPFAPVPEPSMLLLLGSGLMGLAGLRRFSK